MFFLINAAKKTWLHNGKYLIDELSIQYINHGMILPQNSTYLRHKTVTIKTRFSAWIPGDPFASLSCSFQQSVKRLFY